MAILKWEREVLERNGMGGEGGYGGVKMETTVLKQQLKKSEGGRRCWADKHMSSQCLICGHCQAQHCERYTAVSGVLCNFRKLIIKT